MEEGVAIVAERVADRMRELQLEAHYATVLESRKAILSEAFGILQELGETELCTALLSAGKRIGSKLKAYGTNPH